MTSEYERLAGIFAPEFRLERELPPAALGPVFLARAASGEPSRITVLSREVTRRMTAPERFHREMLRAGELSHSNLVPLLASGVTTGGDVYFVTAAPAGRRASDILAQGESVRAGDLGRMGAQVAHALAAAHRAGLIHAAVSPDRIFVDDDRARLSGLGVHAGLLAAGIPAADAVGLMGASPYASPEQIDGGNVGERGDVYALGATLYEMLTGKPPFGGRTTSVVMASVLADEPAVDKDTGVQQPGHVVDAVLRAIERAPDDRWMNALAFADALQAPPPAAGDAAHVPGKRSGCLPAAAALVATAGASYAWWLAR
jgi:eukaryotic-like serine/threonine-protein kinase